VAAKAAPLDRGFLARKLGGLRANGIIECEKAGECRRPSHFLSRATWCSVCSWSWRGTPPAFR